jgi:hypothetical protein
MAKIDKNLNDEVKDVKTVAYTTYTARKSQASSFKKSF